MTLHIEAHASAHQTAIAALTWKPGDPSVFYLRGQSAKTFRAKASKVDMLGADLDGTLARTNTFRELEKGQPEAVVRHGQKTLKAHIGYVSRAPVPVRPAEGESPRQWIKRRGPVNELFSLASESGLMGNNGMGMMKSGFTRELLHALVRGKRARDGAQDLCAAVKHAVAVSAGLENAGELFLELHGFPKHVRIISGFLLEFADDGTIDGSDHNYFPSALKGMLAALLRDEYYGVSREQLLCVGDTPFDAALLREGGLAVGLLPPESEDAGAFHDRLARFGPYWQSVDAMLVGDSLQPLADLIRETRTPTSV